MIDDITREDVATGEYDNEISLQVVKRDIFDHFHDYYCCWSNTEKTMIEVGHMDDDLAEVEPPIVTSKPSEVYTWMNC